MNVLQNPNFMYYQLFNLCNHVTDSLNGEFTQKRKFCLHFLTLMSFQPCISSVEHKGILEEYSGNFFQCYHSTSKCQKKKKKLHCAISPYDLCTVFKVF